MEKTTFTFFAIGTTWVIDLYERLLPTQEAALLSKIRARIDQFDAAYSRFRPDSTVSQIANIAGTYEFPADAEPLFRLYHQLYQISKGAVTPLIGQVLVDAGYDPRYSLQPKPLSRPPVWEEVLEFQSPSTLIVKQPARLDFGALGKGHLIDIVSTLLWDEGYRSYCVEAGGDMVHRSREAKPLRVGLEHPENPEQAVGVATLVNASICGSAGNRRRWDQYHHIIHPHQLVSPTNILAIWVVAKTTLLADAMTTLLYFVEPNIALKYYAFEYAILYPDHSLKASAGFPAEVFVPRST